MKKFRLYWRDGKTEIIEGKDIADAITKAGYGAGAMGALDFHAKGEKLEYDWNPQSREWDRIKNSFDSDENQNIIDTLRDKD